MIPDLATLAHWRFEIEHVGVTALAIYFGWLGRDLWGLRKQHKKAPRSVAPAGGGVRCDERGKSDQP